MLEHSRTSGQVTSVIDAFAYQYDRANRLTTWMVGADVAAYQYDQVNQLIGADRTGALSDETYAYDAAGNRISSTLSGSSAAYNYGDQHQQNRLLSDGTYTYAYDAEGNLQTRTKPGEHVSYSWDHRNRLTRVEYRSVAGGSITKQVDFTYDAHDRRIQKVVDADGAGASAAVSEKYVYDGDELYLHFNGANALQHRYLHGPAVDQILADEDLSLSANNRYRWTLTDHENSVRDIVDSLGTVVNHKVYDSFGRVVSEKDTAAAADVIFGYTGRPFDEETGLQNNRRRYYDPRTGRFISTDPSGFAGGDANLYRYTANSPLLNTDPSGLQKLDSTSEFPGKSSSAQFTEYTTPSLENHVNENNLPPHVQRQIFKQQMLLREAEADNDWVVASAARETINRIIAEQTGMHPEYGRFRLYDQQIEKNAAATSAFLESIGKGPDTPRQWVLRAMNTDDATLVDILETMKFQHQAQNIRTPIDATIFNLRYGKALESGAFDPTQAPDRAISEFAVRMGTDPLTYAPLAPGMKMLRTMKGSSVLTHVDDLNYVNPTGAFAHRAGSGIHAADFAQRYAGDFETVVSNRMRELGVPKEMIGGVTQKLGGTKGAFNPDTFYGGSVFGRRIEVDAGVLIDRPYWKNSRLRDRVDAVIAHEYEEALSSANNVFSRHQESLRNAPTTKLKISDEARDILKNKLFLEAQ